MLFTHQVYDIRNRESGDTLRNTTIPTPKITFKMQEDSNFSKILLNKSGDSFPGIENLTDGCGNGRHTIGNEFLPSQDSQEISKINKTSHNRDHSGFRTTFDLLNDESPSLLNVNNSASEPPAIIGDGLNVDSSNHTSCSLTTAVTQQILGCSDSSQQNSLFNNAKAVPVQNSCVRLTTMEEDEWDWNDMHDMDSRRRKIITSYRKLAKATEICFVSPLATHLVGFMDFLEFLFFISLYLIFILSAKIVEVISFFTQSSHRRICELNIVSLGGNFNTNIDQYKNIELILPGEVKAKKDASLISFSTASTISQDDKKPGTSTANLDVDCETISGEDGKFDISESVNKISVSEDLGFEVDDFYESLTDGFLCNTGIKGAQESALKDLEDIQLNEPYTFENDMDQCEVFVLLKATGDTSKDCSKLDVGSSSEKTLSQNERDISLEEIPTKGVCSTIRVEDDVYEESIGEYTPFDTGYVKESASTEGVLTFESSKSIFIDNKISANNFANSSDEKHPDELVDVISSLSSSFDTRQLDESTDVINSLSNTFDINTTDSSCEFNVVQLAKECKELSKKWDKTINEIFDENPSTADTSVENDKLELDYTLLEGVDSKTTRNNSSLDVNFSISSEESQGRLDQDTLSSEEAYGQDISFMIEDDYLRNRSFPGSLNKHPRTLSSKALTDWSADSCNPFNLSSSLPEEAWIHCLSFDKTTDMIMPGDKPNYWRAGVPKRKLYGYSGGEMDDSMYKVNNLQEGDTDIYSQSDLADDESVSSEPFVVDPSYLSHNFESDKDYSCRSNVAEDNSSEWTDKIFGKGATSKCPLQSIRDVSQGDSNLIFESSTSDEFCLEPFQSNSASIDSLATEKYEDDDSGLVTKLVKPKSVISLKRRVSTVFKKINIPQCVTHFRKNYKKQQDGP